MPTYLIERLIPGAAELTVVELKAFTQQSLLVQQSLGTGIQWLQSIVTGDRLLCLYLASDEGLVREHARRSGLPINKLSLVTAVIDPVTIASD